ncbi:MAG: SRPBCC domain-containing protein [Thermoanaerobaculia bacterium]
MAASRGRVSAALLAACLSPGLARAQADPWAARVRARSDAALATFQGVDCVSIRAPRAIVWRLLVAPEYAAKWFFAGVPAVLPRGAGYKKGPTAEKGDVLSLDATTLEGPRHLEMVVLAAAPGQLLSFLVKSDTADLLDKGIEKLSLTFVLDTPVDGTTDLYLAMHYDPDSPLSAILSPTAVRRQHERRQASLTIFQLLAEEAARMKDPPLHDVPATEAAVPRARK